MPMVELPHAAPAGCRQTQQTVHKGPLWHSCLPPLSSQEWWGSEGESLTEGLKFSHSAPKVSSALR